jgi:hypothetical protein
MGGMSAEHADVGFRLDNSATKVLQRIPVQEAPRACAGRSNHSARRVGRGPTPLRMGVENS